jgi:hypothetical protein
MGNVDAGKSTLVGVLTSGRLDDGRGLARARVFRMQVQYARNGRHLHSSTAISCKRTAICLLARSNPGLEHYIFHLILSRCHFALAPTPPPQHESTTGRTSSISQHLLGFDASRHAVCPVTFLCHLASLFSILLELYSHVATPPHSLISVRSVASVLRRHLCRSQVHQPASNSQTPAAKTKQWQHVMRASQSSVTFIDLCGHERCENGRARIHLESASRWTLLIRVLFFSLCV